MPSSALHLCAHPGCTRWALHGSTTCGPHAHLAAPSRPPIPAAMLHTDSGAPLAAGIADIVALQRDSVHRYLRIRFGHRPPGIAHDLRDLRDLARTNADLGITAGDTSAMDEIDAFLGTIAERALEREAQVP